MKFNKIVFYDYVDSCFPFVNFNASSFEQGKQTKKSRRKIAAATSRKPKAVKGNLICTFMLF